MSSSVPDRLQAALRIALKQRDIAAVSALRSALAAIGNAEALPAEALPAEALPAEALPVAATHRSGGDQYVAGSIAGLGAAEASRRILTEAEIAGLVTTEIAERRIEAARYEQAGLADRADRLRHEADTLAAVVPGDPGGAAGS